MIKKIILFCLGFCALGTTLNGQTQTLPILGMGNDMRSAGMAGVNPVYSLQGNLYSSPTSLLYGTDKGIRLSYQIGFHHTTDANSVTYHQASAGYRLGQLRGVYLGWRYLGGTEVPYVNAMGITRGMIHPRDWAVELGYTRLFGEAFSGWGRVGYLQSYNSVTADVVTASLGADYRCRGFYDDFGDCMLSLSVENFGSNVKYAKSAESFKQPTLARLEGSVSFLKDRNLTLGAGARYLFTGNDNKKMIYNFGGEYRPGKLISLRSGYTLSPYGNVLSLGLGIGYKGFLLDGAYDKHEVKEFNMIRLGITWAL
ncbi:PorV/PorQ family protein [Porphyromonas sp.]|uniref:PorV/PorQ family protein n=1 Tax=Porphyromonas sp. TaxID=1924944 RepID=UPI0026DCB459|nr:PorV/PorQ family protein [Porphyromonas sp.]MDO4770636.1 PorV/PorQ family protein [Porphyromonas sp.]